MSKPASAPRTVECYHCRHRFTVSWQTMTTSCPKCARGLNVEDIIIKVAYAVRKIQTCGRLVVEKKGRVSAHSVEAHGGVDVEGSLEANVVSRGHVRIGPKAQWKGDLTAPTLLVELGGQVTRGFFVIEPLPPGAAPEPVGVEAAAEPPPPPPPAPPTPGARRRVIPQARPRSQGPSTSGPQPPR